MSPRSQTVIVAMALMAAFALFWFRRDGGATFLAFIAGSPIAAAVTSMGKKPAAEQDTQSQAPAASSTPTAPPGDPANG